MRKLISASIIILFISACSAPKLISYSEINEKNYQEVLGVIGEDKPKPDKFAMYPNGLKGIYEHIAKTTRYPSDAIKNKIEGKVLVRFVVDENGQVKRVRVIKSVSPELDKEAKRVIKALERFYPAFKDNKPVKLLYIQPINFKLN